MDQRARGATGSTAVAHAHSTRRHARGPDGLTHAPLPIQQELEQYADCTS